MELNVKEAPVDVCVIKLRLEELGQEQRDLAVAAEVSPVGFRLPDALSFRITGMNP
jgi:hypothetical protein